MKLSIIIFSKEGSFAQTLEYIKKQLKEGFLRGYDKNEKEDFYYEIEKE